MAQNNGNAPQHSEFLIIVVLMGVVIGMLSLLWWVASPMIGKAYAWIRIIETGGGWLFTGWGQYFWRMPFGDKYAFSSIFHSSVTFNLVFGLFIFVLGLIAHHNVSEKHIRAKVQHKKPLGYNDVMKLQAPEFPANQFFLDFEIAKDYSVSKGPARMPITALELLLEVDAIEGIHQGDTLSDPSAATGWKINEDLVTARLVRDFGPLNPFARKNFPFRNKDAIQTAIDAIPWHTVSIVYASVARLYALDTMDTDDFEATNAEIENYLKDIWREINKGKKSLGALLVLGYIDQDDKRLKLEAAKEAYPKKKNHNVLTLTEWLNEEVEIDNRRVSRGESFKTTQRARKELHRILTEFGDVSPDRFVNIKDHKGKIKKHSDLSQLELAKYTQIQKKQERSVTVEIQRLLRANGYQFGLASSLLNETRAGGTLPPSLFRWMRFYDYPLWSYLRVTGMNTPTPEVAGMFDHAQTEIKSGMPLTKPYLVSAVEGVRVEASKYITDDMRRKFVMIQTERSARQKTIAARPQIEATIRTLAKSFAQEAQQKQDEITTRELSDGAIEGNHAPTGGEY